MTKKIAYSILCILATSTGLNAIDWNSAATDSDWNTAANWVGGVVPTASDDVQIKTPAANVTVSAAASTNLLKNGHNSSITVTAGGTLAVTTNAEVGNTGNAANNTGEGTLVVDGGSVDIDGQLFLGKFNDTRTGTITLNSGDISVGSSSTSSGNAVQIGGYDLGTGVINMTGGNFSANGQFWVGKAGAGTLNLSGGTLDLTAGSWQNLRVGNGDGTGTVNMTGGALATEGFRMGKNGVTGNANFNLDGGILTVDGDFTSAITLRSDSELAIGDGVFQWQGDRTTDIGALITSGNITFATSTVSTITATAEQTWTDGSTILYADIDEVKSGYTTIWATSAVPEPSTYALLFGSFLFAWVMLRRR